ncbi:DUF4382 domain-containing protein [Ramlibacter sp.]|uniref:DUF4382 domain-containing protein n=1 Tax=Ramlibacter sp. TaxID=1917967 RepID=UPI002FCBA016
MEKYLGSAGRWMVRAAAVTAALLLAACGGGGGGGDAGEGTLRVSITDAPACYEHVFITVEGVRVHSSSSAGEGDAGWRELKLAAPKRIDLLDLTNGVLEEVGSMPLPAGNYSQLRLVLAENGGSTPLANAVQPIGGTLVPLKTPSSTQSGLKLQVHFKVEADKLIDLVLDFDACRSVVQRGTSDSYLLKPVINVTPKYVAGIQGVLTKTLATSAATVSAQQNGEIVRSTVVAPDGRFVLAFLAKGTYTVVITADGHATGVVTSVPVGTATVTTLNGTRTAIVLPTSPMNTVTGHITASTGSGTNTVKVPVDDALVRAMQNVAGTVVQVNGQQVDQDGRYSFRLPEAAPRRAPYSATELNFKADADAAGKYSLRVTAEGRDQLTRAIDVGGGRVTEDFDY